MKILAIRGKNLASIPEFEIDLSSGVLAETRIFAITGPTGAGKSTLLDALCLGLYDRAPRLFGARDVPVGELGISALDPRSVMRRGAAEAHAEVDFLSRDGERFRAIWEVWRAHKRSDGKIQNQRMRLVELDSGRDISGATKTETQRLIEEKVGLSFGEFRRAVLLAQGDFASFLRAKADERAELLERMTGTEIYARLSRAAFARARQEDERLQALEARRAAVAVLADDDAAALRESMERARLERARLEERLREVRAAEAWHRARLQMIADRDRAVAELALARRAWSDGEPLRLEMARVAEAEKLRSPMETLATLERARARADATFAEAEKNDAECRRHASDSFVAATDAIAAQQQVEEARDAAQPELEAAQRLDVQIEDARVHADEAATLALEAKKSARRADALLEALLDELEAAEEEVRALDRWFEAHADARVLAAQWPRWRRELERSAAAAAAEAQASVEAAALEQARRAVEREAGDLAKVRAELETARAEASGMIERAKAELESMRREVKPVELKTAMERLGLEHASLEAMRTIARETQRLAKLKRESKRSASSESALAGARLEDAREGRARRAAIERELEETEGRLAKLEAELDLAGRRADLLVDGEPCPLCGSRSHPARAKDMPEVAALNGLRERQAALEGRRRAQVEEITAADEAAGRHAQAATAAEQRAVELESELEAKRHEWMKRREAMELIRIDSPVLAKRGLNRIAVSLPEAPKARGVTKELEKAADQMRAHSEALRALAEKDERLAEGLEGARSVQDELTRRAALLAPKLEAADVEHAQLTLRKEAAARATTSAAESRAEAQRALAQPLERRPGWQEALAADPEAYLAALEREVEDWEANVANATAQKQRIAELSRKTALAHAEAERARRDRAKADATRAERLAKQTALERRRRTLLAGRTVEVAQAELAERLQGALARAHEAKGRHALAGQSLAAAEERLEHAEGTRREAALRAGEATERVRAALDASPFADLPSLASALERGPEWLALEQAQLASRKEALTRLEAALAERQRRLDVHERAEHPGADLAQAEAELADLERACSETVEEAARLQERLTSDDAARRSLSDLAPAIASQQWTLEQWSEINALIGSSDGKKFRTFAQGLTLDLLLLASNHHLEQLRPRYRLERVPGWDMELQVVDGDMGEEARPVGTLSGGESFLVSLALALGLSSLSSRNVKIESLFIDEGFGHLDRESLDVALSTLDQLQAEGRTIGLISHVPDIAERIGYQVRVEPKGPGRSEVRVVAR